MKEGGGNFLTYSVIGFELEGACHALTSIFPVTAAEIRAVRRSFINAIASTCLSISISNFDNSSLINAIISPCSFIAGIGIFTN